MPNVLSEIVAHKRIEVEFEKSALSFNDLKKAVSTGGSNFCQGLNKEHINLITEIKPKSPSGGQLRTELDLKSILAAYDSNAAAISVLTDKKYFGGSFELLQTVSESSSLPTLCKDFVLDPYQCYRARLCGAQAVLLIVKILDDTMLGELLQTVRELKMTAVVEVQNEPELERAINLNSPVLLINNRNLDTLAIDLDTTKRLAPLVPDSIITISASGITSKEDLSHLLPYCKNFLIGSSLMKSEKIEEKIKELKEPIVAHRS